jgi:uncharacterized membrane protein YgdD (TMEM256/DUF423 family)
MLLVVALGAFGAHALKERLQSTGHQGTWATAVLYQAIHGLALFGIGVWQALDARARASRAVDIAAWCWLAGIVGFSGSLYLLSLGGPRWLGPVTPLGGLGFMAGWVALVCAAWRLGRAGTGTSGHA